MPPVQQRLDVGNRAGAADTTLLLIVTKTQILTLKFTPNLTLPQIPTLSPILTLNKKNEKSTDEYFSF